VSPAPGLGAEVGEVVEVGVEIGVTTGVGEETGTGVSGEA
jgi:hypothetical protein